MIYLSEVLIQNPQLDSFDKLLKLIEQLSQSSSEIHMKIDIKPNYQDTPGNWEDRLEGAFSGLYSHTYDPSAIHEDD